MHRLLEHLPGQEPSSRAGQTVALRASEAEPVMVLDDSAYGSGEFRAELAERGHIDITRLRGTCGDGSDHDFIDARSHLF
jgi:hypothetical protein